MSAPVSDATALARGPRREADPFAASSPPIYQTASFCQPSAEGGGEYDYSRSGNPTRDRLEEELREAVQAAVRKQEPRATEENLRKYWLVASGWRGPHVLDIAFRAKYEGDVGAFDYDTQVTVGERLTLSPAQPKRLAE